LISQSRGLGDVYKRQLQNYIEIEQKVKYCIECDNKILSNTGFFQKKLGDELPESTTICGFCYKCNHHVLPSDCYERIEFSWLEDYCIRFCHIYKEDHDLTIINPLLKN
jgi:hypothetical protein